MSVTAVQEATSKFKTNIVTIIFYPATQNIIDNWNNYTINEKEQGIAEIVVMLYENLAFKCIEKYDQSLEMQLKIYMTSLIQEALDKVINK